MSESPRTLTLYVDPAWRKEGLIHSTLLNPFWGVPKERDNALLRAMLARNFSFNTALYSITDAKEKADMIFMPYSHRDVRRYYPELLPMCALVATETGKPLFVDGIEDIPHALGVPNCFVLRYGGYRFEPSKYEIVIPPFANDLLELYENGLLTIRKKGTVPTIAFAGWSSLTFYQTLRTVIKELPDRLHSLIDSRYKAKRKGVFFRQQAMRSIERSSLVRANFITRTSYSGHTDTVSKDIETLQREYIDNLLASDYGLDVRGDANASTRLFEILSLGRIPIIVDTERNFPFSDEVAYEDFALTIDFRDIHLLPKLVAEFHARISEEAFEAMQQRAREAYVSHFRIDALMRHIIKELIKKGALL